MALSCYACTRDRTSVDKSQATGYFRGLEQISCQGGGGESREIQSCIWVSEIFEE